MANKIKAWFSSRIRRTYEVQDVLQMGNAGAIALVPHLAVPLLAVMLGIWLFEAKKSKAEAILYLVLLVVVFFYPAFWLAAALMPIVYQVLLADAFENPRGSSSEDEEEED